VAYETILALAAASANSGGGAAPPPSTAPLCTVLCANNCTPPCDANCSRLLFEAELQSFAAGTAHFYIDPWEGSDGAPGDSPDRPWATVRRGQAQMRWVRAVNPASAVQLWLRGDPTATAWSWRALQLGAG